jgi:hypothetical protein
MQVNNLYTLALTVIMLSISNASFGQTDRIINQSIDQIRQENAVLENKYEEIEVELNNINVSIYRKNEELKNTIYVYDSLTKYRKIIWEQMDQKERLEKAIINKQEMLITNQGHLKDTQKKLADIAHTRGEIECAIKSSGEKYVKLILNLTTKPFSSITKDDIDNVKSSLNYFSELDCCKEYSSKFRDFQNVYELYLKARNALYKESDKIEIKNFRDNIINALNVYDQTNSANRIITPGQYTELDNLDIALSRYASGVAELYKIVESINNDTKIIELRKVGNSEECIKMMMLYIKKNDNNKRVFERYFETIPYLNDLRVQYWDELQANPIDTTNIENEIIKLWKLWN